MCLNMHIDILFLKIYQQDCILVKAMRSAVHAEIICSISTRIQGYIASTTASKHLIGNDSLIISLAHSIKLQLNMHSSIFMQISVDINITDHKISLFLNDALDKLYYRTYSYNRAQNAQ